MTEKARDPLKVANDADNGLRWYTVSELATLPRASWLVDGHFPDRGLVLIYGPSGSAKSFLALDLALCIATGRDWHGDAVSQGGGPVAYILAEGRSHVAQRCAAWLVARGIHDPPENLCILPEPVSLLDDKAVEQLVADLLTWQPSPRLVVIDTLAWCLAPGDENSTRDMSIFVAALGRIREATCATVAVVHHTGHNKSRERGNTALRGAVDTTVRVTKKDNTVTLKCEKQRDAPEFADLRLRLTQSGSSLVLEDIRSRGINNLTGTERAVFVKLCEMQADEGTTATAWLNAAGVPERTFYHAVERLKRMAVIRWQKDGRQVRYWPVARQNLERSE